MLTLLLEYFIGPPPKSDKVKHEFQYGQICKKKTTQGLLTWYSSLTNSQLNHQYPERWTWMGPLNPNIIEVKTVYNVLWDILIKIKSKKVLENFKLLWIKDPEWT